MLQVELFDSLIVVQIGRGDLQVNTIGLSSALGGNTPGVFVLLFKGIVNFERREGMNLFCFCSNNVKGISDLKRRECVTWEEWLCGLSMWWNES